MSNDDTTESSHSSGQCDREGQHPATLPQKQLQKDCRLKRVRRSGPGGQRRNKVFTGIVLVHQPSGVRVESNQHRSAEMNESAAWKQLRMKLACEIRAEVAEESPSELWKSRCRNKKIRVNPDHEDFPAIVAEVLDMLALKEGELQPLVNHFQCSSSQLIKLLKSHPKALLNANMVRKQFNLHSWQ